MKNMCERTIKKSPWQLECVPDQLKTQEMCNEVVCKTSAIQLFVPDNLKTQDMCNKAVKDYFSLYSTFLIGLKEKNN